MSNSQPIKLFYSYAHKDEELRDELETHLNLLQRQGVISVWHDRKIEIGTEWKDAIDDNLKAADIILLLISADFLASNYCFDIEMRCAMERHESKSAVVIPISLRPCDTIDADFMKLQGLPKDFKPVTKWTHRDDAFTDIAKGIRVVANSIKRIGNSAQLFSVPLPQNAAAFAFAMLDKLPASPSVELPNSEQLPQQNISQQVGQDGVGVVNQGSGNVTIGKGR
jgi:hypothetical protein